MCPAKVPGEYEPTPALPHFPRPLNRQGQRSLSVFLLLSDPLQLWPATLNSETPPKSTGCRLAAWHLTESLAPDRFSLTKTNTCSTIEMPASLRSENCSSSARNAVRVPLAIGVRLRRNPQLGQTLYARYFLTLVRKNIRVFTRCVLERGSTPHIRVPATDTANKPKPEPKPNRHETRSAKPQNSPSAAYPFAPPQQSPYGPNLLQIHPNKIFTSAHRRPMSSGFTSSRKAR